MQVCKKCGGKLMGRMKTVYKPWPDGNVISYERWCVRCENGHFIGAWEKPQNIAELKTHRTAHQAGVDNNELHKLVSGLIVCGFRGSAQSVANEHIDKYLSAQKEAKEAKEAKPSTSNHSTSPSASQIADAIEGVVAGGAKWNRANAADAFKGLCQQLREL